MDRGTTTSATKDDATNDLTASLQEALLSPSSHVATTVASEGDLETNETTTTTARTEQQQQAPEDEQSTHQKQQQQQQPHPALGTPSSLLLAGDIDEESSPNRSFVQTRFYGNLMQNLYPQGNDDEDEDEDEVAQEDRGDNHDSNNNNNDHEQDLPRLVCVWNRWIARWHGWILLLTVLLVWPFGVQSFAVFHSQTDSTFRSLPGTRSAAAQDAFDSAYNSWSDWQNPMNPPLIVVLQATNSSISLTNANNSTFPAAFAQAQAFALNLSCALPAWTTRAADDKDATRDGVGGGGGWKKHHHHNSSSNQTDNDDEDAALWPVQVVSYYSLQQQGLDWLAQATASPGGRSTVIQIDILPPPNFTGDAKSHMFALMDAVEQYSAAFVTAAASNKKNETSFFTVHFTGIHWFQRDLIQATRTDMWRMDVLVLPLALLLLGVVLPRANPRAVWIIPLVGMITTVCVWSIAMRQVVRVMQITQFTPTLMMSLSLGMGIDYTLFLLVRYLESYSNHPPSSAGSTMTTTRTRRRRTKRQRAMMIGHMMCQGGNVVVLSGLTLMGTFLGLLLLPLQMLRSVGVGAAVAIAAALLVNLTVVPALLYTAVGQWIVRSSSDDDADNNSNNNNRLAPSDDQGGEQEAVHNNNNNNNNNINTPSSVDDATRAILVEESHNDNSVRVDDDTIHRLLEDADDHDSSPSVWYRMSKHLLHPYKGIIILLVVLQVLIFPVGLKSTRVKSSLSFDLLLPADSPSLKTYHELGTQFGGLGRLHPYRILFDGRPANKTLTSPAGFDVMNTVIHKLQTIDMVVPESSSSSSSQGTTTAMRNLNHHHHRNDSSAGIDHQIEYLSNEIFQRGTLAPFHNSSEQTPPTAGLVPATTSGSPQHQRPTMFNGISVVGNQFVPYSVYVAAKLCGHFQHPHCSVELLHVIDTIDRSATAHGLQATYTTVTLGVNPFSEAGIAWLQSARAMIEDLSRQDKLNGVQVHIQGIASIEYDAMNTVYQAFPKMICITAVVVFTLMGVFFRSLFTPLRSVISIALTLGFSFGLGVAVYQDGTLDWTRVRPLTTVNGGFSWLVPVMAFSIIVGLALDYDVFLISRVLEYREEGRLEHKTSIAAGLHSTGPIITAAGGIMALAFGSLMLSSSPMLFQWSFLLTSAVLLDTFVVRTVVVPVVTSLAGSYYCWWPRELPESRFYIAAFRRQRSSNEEEDDVRSLLRSLEETSEYEPISRVGSSS